MWTKINIILLLSGFTLMKQLSVNSNYITSDIFDNIYAVNKYELNQFDKEGTLLNTYSNRNLGNISFMDVSNPLRILVFYNNFNSILFLNNKLSPIAESVSLDDIGFSSVGSACSSSQNGFWIFDLRNMQPVLISSSLSILYKGSNITIPDSLSSSLPIYMCEDGKKLYLAFQHYGLFIFDQTGMQQQFIPIDSLKYLHIRGTQAYYLAGNQLYQLNIENNSKSEIKINIEKCYGFALLNDILILASDRQVSFYKANIE